MHAAAECKTEISQRLTAARLELDWSCDFNHDFPLSVVQWSALTRALHEPSSNALHQAQAGRVEVDLRLQGHGPTLRRPTTVAAWIPMPGRTDWGWEGCEKA